MGSFRGVSLQSTVVNDVEDLIKRFPRYRSVAEFVSEAVRLRLEAVEQNTVDDAATTQETAP
jgi:Arc/MetJ-type ribon-helix-helix transcriptional regulator